VSSGLFYFYRVTNEGSLVGFFANRNHQALLLAMALPLLACWGAAPDRGSAFAALRGWIALCMGVAIIPLLLVTGSRGGLILGAIGAVAAIALTIRIRRERGRPLLPRGTRSRLLLLTPLAAGIVAVGATVYLARDEAIQRLQGGAIEETRTRYVPVIAGMVREYLPLGTGFGAFDTTFRSHEAEGGLTELYLNHAHNDVLEVVLEGGLLPVPLILVFLGWFAMRSWRLWRSPEGKDRMVARTGGALVLMMLVGSVLDYPLRTPFMAVLFAIAAIWMLGANRDVEAESTV
jgi:O-antigen ligase